MKRRPLANIVFGQSASIVEEFCIESQSLSIDRYDCLALNLGLHIANGVRGLHIESNGLSRNIVDENLVLRLTMRWVLKVLGESQREKKESD